MKKLIKKYVFFINAVNFIMCELYADKHFLFGQIKNRILSNKYKESYYQYRHNYCVKRYCNMNYFDTVYSPFLFVVLFTPISLFFANIVRCFLQLNIFYIYCFFEILLSFPIWKYPLLEKESKKQIRMYERLSKRYLRCWCLLLLSIIILDIILIILLNLM